MRKFIGFMKVMGYILTPIGIIWGFYDTCNKKSFEHVGTPPSAEDTYQDASISTRNTHFDSEIDSAQTVKSSMRKDAIHPSLKRNQHYTESPAINSSNDLRQDRRNNAGTIQQNYGNNNVNVGTVNGTLEINKVTI